jgi:peptidoglycan-N-acetylglucosamine deacetylase
MNPWFLAPPVVLTGLAGLTAFGAVHPRAQLFGPTLTHTGAAKKLALTFDDGPNLSITPRLLELLEQHNAKATFFVVGKFVRECPGLVKEIAARGHVIANHTDTHPNLFFCGPADTREELLRCSDAIRQVTWAEPRWFRPPFGFRSPWLGELVQRQAMRTVMWSLLPGDWRAKPAEWLVPRLQPIATRAQTAIADPQLATYGRGDILCLHDGDYTRQNGDRSRTLDALEYWLPRWSELGLEFVTMNQI